MRAIRFAEVVVLLIDAERPFEHQDLTIGHRVTEEGRALVIAINKWDLVAEKQKDAARPKRHRCREPGAGARRAARRDLGALGERARSVDAGGRQNARNVEQARFDAAAQPLARRSAAAATRRRPRTGRRIKIRYITQPSTRPPTFVAFCQRADALPQSYVKYLTNSLREAFDLPGVPIRFSLRKGENPFAKS